MQHLNLIVLKFRLRHTPVKEMEPGRYRLGFRKGAFELDAMGDRPAGL